MALKVTRRVLDENPSHNTLDAVELPHPDLQVPQRVDLSDGQCPAVITGDLGSGQPVVGCPTSQPTVRHHLSAERNAARCRIRVAGAMGEGTTADHDDAGPVRGRAGPMVFSESTTPPFVLQRVQPVLTGLIGGLLSISPVPERPQTTASASAAL